MSALESIGVVLARLAMISCGVVTFPDEGHGIARQRNQQVLFARLVQIFDFDAYQTQ